jgi:6-phosphofructokinase
VIHYRYHQQREAIHLSALKGACIIGQSGGPTAVINASAYGAIKTALEEASITRVLGALNGIKGVLDDNLIDMGQEDPQELAYMKYTPASALGSCRYKLKDPDVDDTDYKRILEIFKKYDVRYFFYNGGNDSMDTCNKISKFMLKNGYECRVMGIPKTIDNDLEGTDHCPGFASAAKYIATSCMEVYHDARVYDTSMITIIECMGRHAGWLTAACALACAKGFGPDLIYLPEVVFDMDKFIASVKAVYEKQGKCFVAVSEGIHDADGVLVTEYAGKSRARDSFGHAQLGGLAAYLANEVKKATGAKVRGIELSLLQRCAAHCASQTDIDESFATGEAAVKHAVAGVTDRMVGYERVMVDGKYTCNIKLFPLEDVANTEKKVPREWINEAGDGIEQGFIDYALPLIQGQTKLPMEDSLPRFVRLKKIKA